MKITKDFKFSFADPEAPEVSGETKVFCNKQKKL